MRIRPAVGEALITHLRVPRIVPRHRDTFDAPEDWEDVVEARLSGVLAREAVREKGLEDRKTMDEVFDKSTLLTLYKLISNGHLETLDYPVSTGKEANVFHATARGGGSLAVKIFRTNTATFRSFMTYINGDPRFESVRPNRRDVVYAWAQKEFKNLQRLAEAQVRVPLPYAHTQNVLVMEFIGDAGTPAPRLKDAPPADPAAAWQGLLEQCRRVLQDAGLVHGDLSEYNILNWREEMVLIDVAQGVLLRHPMRDELMRRDAVNIARFFRKLGVAEATPEAFLAATRPVKEASPE